jgi:uncharacterized membrane protein YebE (DUF533 family)
MDLSRVLGALLGGAAQPPRRRRRSTTTSLLGGRGAEARAARALGAFAGAAIEQFMRGRPDAGSRSEPHSDPAPRPAPRPPARTSPAKPAAPARRIPEVAAPPAATPDAPGAEAAEALLLVRAMIAAARADGSVDAAERTAIAGQLDAAGLTAEERDFVLADFDRPLAPEALARQATDPMLRARLYAAAFAGAGEVTTAERAWLDSLARALKLDKAAAAAIEERLGA